MLNAQEIRMRAAVNNRYAKGYVLFLVVAGVGLIFLGVHLGQGMQAFLAGAERTGGEVVRVESVRRDDGDGGSSYTYYPFVAFSGAGGEHLEFRDKVGSNPAIYKRGDKVDVLFDPANPEDAIIDRGFWNWTAAAGSFAGGILSLLWSMRLLGGIGKRRGRI